MSTGGLTEIRVRNYNAFAAYAFFLRNFREELFSRSRKWSFPLESFLTELDSLVKFYVKIFHLIENKCVKIEDREILGKQLIEPLALFFKSIDSEFGINYFQNSVEKFKADKSSDIIWIDYSIGQALDKMADGEDTRAEPYKEIPKTPLPKTIEFGTCPKCKCTDSEVIKSYPETAMLKCWNCDLVYGQKEGVPL